MKLRGLSILLLAGVIVADKKETQAVESTEKKLEKRGLFGLGLGGHGVNLEEVMEWDSMEVMDLNLGQVIVPILEVLEVVKTLMMKSSTSQLPRKYLTQYHILYLFQ
ncbi:hypothetical protein WA026_009821 [Henosepilachna vigintioctopunctata]|uniref:Uncharacterized protein n=1 Tax=Henosepilachna vigintioctopunctata TaxID=420089 RepID=A0AAW1TLC0_9CUCU